jgi:hypothetical protein
MVEILARYDTWKTNKDEYVIDYQARGRITVQITFDKLASEFSLSGKPHSHDELYQYITDDLKEQIDELIESVNVRLRYLGGNVSAKLVEIEEQEVLSSRGQWA